MNDKQKFYERVRLGLDRRHDRGDMSRGEYERWMMRLVLEAWGNQLNQKRDVGREPCS